MKMYITDDYKRIIKYLMDDKKQIYSGRYTFEKMAKASGIQKSYLSRVLNGGKNLSSDQVYLIAEYLKLDEIQRSYLMLSYEFCMTKVEARRNLLKIELKKISDSQLNTKQYVSAEKAPITVLQAWEYYTSPNMQLTHIFLTVEKYQQEPQLIARALDLSKEKFSFILERLKTIGLVEVKNSRFVSKEFNFHLDEKSPIYGPYRMAQRQKVLQKLTNSTGNESNAYFFSATFCADESVYFKTREKILALLKEAHAEVTAAKSENIFQLNIDLFQWDE